MVETVQMSFEGAYEDPSPMVVVYNPRVLPAALLSQIMRFGLVGATASHPPLSGKLKGSRKALTEVIQSYGLNVEIVPVRSI
ncbi:MAG TPA: hypothetical protein VG845_13910 [Dehalococcoidia bacterium]|jgi:hypothetical protein|nr:hypothetical protein [Dehalococcoidia bacterium]